ncbi:MAG: homoserine kinase [Lachnospirales bacterium]
MIIAKVPATSANLGSGFDTLGIALNIYNCFKVKKSNTLEFINCEPYDNTNNLFYKSLVYILKKGKYNEDFNFTIEACCDIPFGSGLGSSATCIVGGLLVGNTLLKNKFNINEVHNFAVEIEGHGDNVTPCIFGGLTSYLQKEENFYAKFNLSNSYKVAVLTSNQSKIGTNELRKILPSTITFDDCTFNISHGINTLAGLINGNINLIRVSMDDKIHEQYRGKSIQDYQNIKNNALVNNCISLCISGAGPSLILIYNESFNKTNFSNYLNTLENNWQLIECGYTNTGAEIIIEGEQNE